MELAKSLKPEELYKRCDLSQFSFKTTNDLEDLREVIGQTRAVEAVKFGINIKRKGYNLFALGPSGIDKQSIVRHFLEEKSRQEPTPPDYCYVNNFEQLNKPRILELPPGRGMILRQDIEQLLEELCSAIPAAFENEDYRTRKRAIEEEFKEHREKEFEKLHSQAQERNIDLLRTPSGVVFAPMKNEEVISPEDFNKLPEPEQKRIEEELTKFQEQLRNLIQQVPQWEKESREKIKELDREVTIFAVGHLLEELLKKYADLPEVIIYLDDIEQDVLDNADNFLDSGSDEESEDSCIIQSSSLEYSPLLRRYLVNVLVDNSATQGAPIVYENNPTYRNLIGQVEHIAHMGTLVTDFNLIKGGALHRANGGYLIIDAYKLLQQPYAWDGLKRALFSNQIRIESIEQALSMVSTVSLEPESIPLNIKVVLLGERIYYYMLNHYDPEFNELFKVSVDFDEQMDRSSANDLLYARMIGAIAQKEELLPFDRNAVARVIEQSARLIGDADKLSTQMEAITDLLRESDYWAREAGNSTVSVTNVQRAIDAQIKRADRLRERIQEEIQNHTILIETEGEKVGQINGLSVIEMGNFAFGHPSRITARVRLGKGEVIDIERQVAMGGPIHSKGVLILSGYLGGRYAPDRPLSLSASLVFEQSYSGVEGDSASSAELYALLFALAKVPIKQSLAVTGSVDQQGQIQAIGGVNEKIEGFFDLCNAKGLTGEQGVLIPASNKKHLMLRQDVIDAVAANKFHIFPVETIDQGLELLADMPAGERNEAGDFPEGSINHLIEARLIEMAKNRSKSGIIID